jgi:HK97 family phage major capsid protein
MTATLDLTPNAGRVPLNLTDPEQVRQIFSVMLGSPEGGALIRDAMKAGMKDLGMTRVDRSFLAVPEVIPQEQRPDFDTIMGRGMAGRSPLQQRMGEWFRAVLFNRMPQDAIVIRALSEGTDSEGGYVVPPGFIPEVIRDVEKLSNLYQHCRVISVPTNAGEIPVVATNAGVTWGSEGVAFGQSDPAFGTKTYAVQRMNVLVKISRELANDANPNIVDLVTQLFREKVVEERDKVVAIGTGSGQPMGLYSATGLTEVSFTSLTYSNIVDLHETVDERYFPSPSTRWVFNQRVKEQVMKILDDNGRPIFQVDPANGFRATILGHPVSIESRCPNNFMFFGDLRYYMIFTREQLGVEQSTQAGDAFAAHQMWMKFWERWDGKPVLPPTCPMARNRTLVVT